MKKLFITLAITSCAAFASAAKKTTETMKPGDTAIATCKTLVSSVVKKDFASVKALSTRPNMPTNKKLSEKNFDKMHDKHLAELKDLNCIREVVSEDHAFVEAESEGNKRLIPFIKSNEGWMFDSGTYMSFYNVGKKTKNK